MTQPYLYKSPKETGSEKPTVPVEGYVKTPPFPGTESAGPAMFDLLKELHHAAIVSHSLLRQSMDLLTQQRSIVEHSSANTDASGNLDLVIYKVPLGYEVIITRINIEAGGFTPASGFSAATAWLGIVDGDRFAAQGGGSLVDFLPNPPAASGVILPAVITDGVSEAGVFRGGQTISLHVANGPVSTGIWVRLQGLIKAV